MDTGSRSCRWHHAEAAVQIGVVTLQTEIDPSPLRKPFVGHLQVHRFRCGIDGPCWKAELSTPAVIVCEFKQINFHQRHDHWRPGPRMLFQIEKCPFRMSSFCNPSDWGNPLINHRLLTTDQNCTQRVRLAPDRKNLVFGIQWIDSVSCVDRDPFRLGRGIFHSISADGAGF